ncbi:MAG: HigA family addiction module antidote protein [Deferribacteraceae bacterium]|jgi:addiction module HigA family antidote|nr:HigA family addiction module antidote protein [Deferribacteraceae bacterium]
MDKINIKKPGEILKTYYLDEMNITTDKLASDIDLPLHYIEDLVNGREAITTDVAIRLATYFNNTFNYWSNLQSNYEKLELQQSGEYNTILSRIQKQAVG